MPYTASHLHLKPGRGILRSDLGYKYTYDEITIARSLHMLVKAVLDGFFLTFGNPNKDPQNSRSSINFWEAANGTPKFGNPPLPYIAM